jgi:hypothetical protein
MNKDDVDRMFGSANVEKVESFKIDGGYVDFGDDWHVGGSPQGDAVVGWSIDGRVAVKGKLYSDNLLSPQKATVRIRFRRANGQVTNNTTRTITTHGGWVGSREIEKVSPAGNFNEVRIKLEASLETGLGTINKVVATRTFRR